MKQSVRLSNKVMQTISIGDETITADVRNVYVKKGKGIFGSVHHNGNRHRVMALGFQCWKEVA